MEGAMSDLYEQDFIGWTEQQARVLREAAAHGTNLPLDWTNLIEEVEGLGRSQYDAVATQIRRAILHLLKLQFSPATNPRAGWISSVRQARAEIDGRLETDPGLRPRLAGMVRREWPRALGLAAEELADHGDDQAALQVRRHADDMYSQEQILGDWLPERPDRP
jgi:Domain of unknown function DUF29